MTIKQEIEQLLSRNVCVCCYRVEVLNCAFKPRETYEYSSIDGAEKKYNELTRAGYRSGFLKKYAVVKF